MVDEAEVVSRAGVTASKPGTWRRVGPRGARVREKLTEGWLGGARGFVRRWYHETVSLLPVSFFTRRRGAPNGGVVGDRALGARQMGKSQDGNLTSGRDAMEAIHGVPAVQRGTETGVTDRMLLCC